MDFSKEYGEKNFGIGPIFQSDLPEVPWIEPHTRKLPGIQPLGSHDWLRVDSAYAGQMALRDRLVAQTPDLVLGMMPGSEDAVSELFETVKEDLKGKGEFSFGETAVTRPDGVVVPINSQLEALARLAAEDFCILQEGPDDEHLMTAAMLCFPSGWTLAQKLGRPLTTIHTPVPSYDANIARRVQRMFNAIRPGNGLWRTNAHEKPTPELFTPRLEGQLVVNPPGTPIPFIRSERQCLIRLPKSNAIVFSIHTRMIPKERLTEAQQTALLAHPIEID